jgi:hypothetical protein
MRNGTMTSLVPILVANFEDDIRIEYVKRLSARSVPHQQADPLATLIGKYHAIAYRKIPPRKRTTQWSTQLHSRLSALPSAYQQAIGTIVSLSESGGNLDGYLSRDLATGTSKPDHQLLQWSVTHFHLGTGPDPKRSNMVAGTPDLLFVIVGSDSLFLIDVMPHASFSSKALFDAAFTSWPHLFQSSQVPGAIQLQSTLSDAERLQLWRSKINTLTAAPGGEFHVPAGGGITAGGIPTHVMRDCVFPRIRAIKGWQRRCDERPDWVIALIPAKSRDGIPMIQLTASETPLGLISVAAVNLPAGRFTIGVGPPEKL